MSSLKIEEKVRREKSDIDRLWSRSEQCNVRIQQAIIDFEDGGRGAQAQEFNSLNVRNGAEVTASKNCGDLSPQFKGIKFWQQSK